MTPAPPHMQQAHQEDDERCRCKTVAAAAVGNNSGNGLTTAATS